MADGSRARLFASHGRGSAIETVSEGELQGLNVPGREINSDRPGRTFDSAGAGRHAKEPKTDPREVEKQRFTRDLAKMLHKELGKGRFEQLVLVAPPQELGRLRAELSAAVSERVSAELNKDLTHETPTELAKHLKAVMAV